MHIPDGFARVTPYIFVDDATSYIDFLTAAFGAHETLRSLAPDGRIANAQIQISGATLMVSEASAAFPPGRAAFYLYVENADASMRQAESAGGEVIMAVADMPYEDRQGGIRDPAGNIWWVSQRLTDAPYV